MTAQPLRYPGRSGGLRVITGRKLHRPSLAPWLVFSLVAVIAFLGMVLTRTALDRSSIELSSIEREIAAAKTSNQLLRLEIGRLESPARIAPMALEMGMVYPSTSQKLMVANVIPGGSVDPRWADVERVRAARADDSPASILVDQPQAAASTEQASTLPEGSRP